ncbi:hypothetical protein PF010_g29049 [Phytophthora fragariae]|uniref:Transposase Tc1-like domain-containing protein n=1 Tax=Phytophthora fragariae TaxID=53985 RepID=A0A6A3R6H2_9STRA|nr:hypothetical protein PF003_g29387 [Phytophthora fragariae]KAE9063308.1 hypothetical protein PF010_g29049 [Phytophthora fragariae]KAE9089557.1 hypothetical protein PF006_g25337 [Phytophthora fragariae]KAE9168226.1 hypothetical protein PF004_g28574 [Phytophthora fragariae]
MGRQRHQYSHDLRVLFVQKHHRGLGYKKIAKILEMSAGSVRNIVKYYKKHGHSVVSPRSGRKKITDVRQDRRIVREVEANRFVSATRLAVQVEANIGRKISAWTIRARIHAAGLNGRTARKNPYLSKKHRRARLAYAKKYDHLTAEQFFLLTKPGSSSMGRLAVYRYGTGLTRLSLTSVYCRRLRVAASLSWCGLPSVATASARCTFVRKA